MFKLLLSILVFSFSRPKARLLAGRGGKNLQFKYLVKSMPHPDGFRDRVVAKH